MSCDARFGWAHPGLTLVLDCEMPGESHFEHQATWNHGLNVDQPFTVVHWYEDDRRCFRGEWVQCPGPAVGVHGQPADCCLPADHQGTEHFA